MSVFLISDVTIRDGAAFETYQTRDLGPRRRYLMRGGTVEVLEQPIATRRRSRGATRP